MQLTKEHIYSVANPLISPNECEAVFVRTHFNEESALETQLFHLDLATDVVEQWTFGESVSHVQWLRDGSAVSFLRKIGDKQQLFQLSKEGEQQLTYVEGNAQHYVWQPCGTKIWLEVANDKQDEGDVGTCKQIVCFTIATGEIDCVTADGADYTLHAVSHSGEQLVIERKTEQDDEFSTTLLFVNTKTKEQTVFLQANGVYRNVAYSFDDRYIAYVGHDATFGEATQNSLYIYDRAENWTNNVTLMMDMHIGDAAISDVQCADASVIRWTELNDLYCQASVMGDVRLYYVTLDGAVYPASPEDEHVMSFDVFKSGNAALATISNPTFIGELFFLDITTGERRQLTHFNDVLHETLTLSAPEQVIFDRDGFTVYGWLLKPVPFEENRTYSLTIAVQSELAMYANTFFYEFQLLAAQGNAVLYINPRGSHGYSQQFANASEGNADIVAAIDEVSQQYAWIDAERVTYITK